MSYVLLESNNSKTQTVNEQSLVTDPILVLKIIKEARYKINTVTEIEI